MKKKIFIGIAIIAIIVVTFLCLTLAQSKNGITVEKFEEKAKENGYTVVEIENEISNSESVVSARVAASTDYSTAIEFYILKDNDTANTFFNTNKEAFAKLKQEGNEEVEKNGKNYNTYTLKTNGKYMYISKVENTVLQFEIHETSEKKVTEFIKKLGY